MLQLDQVRIANGGFRLAADLSVEAGARVAVMGPSGAGKSTLVNGIAGFHPVIAGRMIWAGTEFTETPPGERPVAMLFQDGNLFPHLSVRKNAALGLHPGLKLTGAEWARVDAALEEVGLADLGQRLPAALSGGQQSRAALARVLLQARPLLVLDEPFSALGPALKTEMLDLVARIAGETEATVLMVTHDPADARRLADQIIVVSDGKAHPPADLARTFDDPPPALRAYLG